jgi:hypothetical protein
MIYPTFIILKSGWSSAAVGIGNRNGPHTVLMADRADRFPRISRRVVFSMQMFFIASCHLNLRGQQSSKDAPS